MNVIPIKQMRRSIYLTHAVGHYDVTFKRNEHVTPFTPVVHQHRISASLLNKVRAVI